jgi:hypothetical protein
MEGLLSTPIRVSRFAFRINIAVRGDLAPVLVKRQLVQQRGIH